jgi:hypothetical protein
MAGYGLLPAPSAAKALFAMSFESPSVATMHCERKMRTVVERHVVLFQINRAINRFWKNKRLTTETRRHGENQLKNSVTQCLRGSNGLLGLLGLIVNLQNVALRCTLLLEHRVSCRPLFCDIQTNLQTGQRFHSDSPDIPHPHGRSRIAFAEGYKAFLSLFHVRACR